MTDDELRDELAHILHRLGCEDPCSGNCILDASAVVPVVRRFADAQVAAERAAWWQRLIGVRVNRGSDTNPDWWMHHPDDVELIYPDEMQP